MKLRRLQTGIAGCLLLILSLLGCGQPAVNPGEAATVAAIQKLGGKVEFDEKSPDRPVIKVYLHGTAVKDADLAVLKDLKKLQNLFLGKTKISDAGLEHLKTLPQLHTLSLNSTEVSDAGLKQLSAITTLQTLNLQESKVSVGGAEELRRSLPNTRVAR